MPGNISSTSKMCSLLAAKRSKPTAEQKQNKVNIDIWTKIIELINGYKYIPIEDLRKETLLKEAGLDIAQHKEEINKILKSSIIKLIQEKNADLTFSGNKGKNTVFDLLKGYYRRHMNEFSDNLGQLVERLTHVQMFQYFCNDEMELDWADEHDIYNIALEYFQIKQPDPRNNEMITVALQCPNLAGAQAAVMAFEQFLHANANIAFRSPDSYQPNKFIQNNDGSEEVTAYIHYWPKDYRRIKHSGLYLSVYKKPAATVASEETSPTPTTYVSEIFEGEEPENESPKVNT